MLNFRRDSVSKEAVHILVGITKEGYEEVLDFGIYPSELCKNYKEMLQSIKNVDVQKFFFLSIMD